ncbi:MAG TPA: hypothetical protein ENN89_05530 [Synergistetes bacterium]|nr:hypothetical protein [Synergistota bacterium]
MEGKEVDLEEKGPKAKKVLRILGIVLLFTALFSGIVAGLLFGGGFYHLSDSLVPVVMDLPFVGAPVARFLQGLTPAVRGSDRRILEIEQKERQIVEMMLELDREKRSLEKREKELALERKSNEEKLRVLRSEEDDKDPADEGKPRFYGMLVESFEEMPPSRAAKIVELLSIREAAELFGLLGSGQRSDILSKMPSEAAARLLRYARQQEEGLSPELVQAGAAEASESR